MNKSILEQLYQKRQTLLRAKDYQGVWEVLNQILKIAPSSQHFENRGDFFLSLKKYQEALNDFEKAQSFPHSSVSSHSSELPNKIIQLRSSLEKNSSFVPEDKVSNPSMILQKASSQVAELFVEKNTVSNQFGRYQLKEELGRGGMGKVHLAFDENLNRKVAIKMVLGGGDVSRTMTQRFMQEAQAIARINHPYVIKIFDIGQENEVDYFAMEYIQGKSLSQAIKEKEFSSHQIIELLEKVTSAIQEAHQHGIIHRDLKSANIMLDNKGEPRVMDFGLAKIAENDSNLSQSGAILGTPAYMSPEQAQGNSSKVDYRSDLYSLGAILYEMLTGVPPFQGQSNMHIMLQVIEKDPVLLRSLNPDIPKDLEIICLKCLSKEPIKRYQKAEELREDLQCFLDNRPLSYARPPTLLNNTVKWCYRYPAVALLLITITSATILSLWFAWQLHNVNKEKDQVLETSLVRLKKAQKEKRTAVQEHQKAQKKLANSLFQMGESHLILKNFIVSAQKIIEANELFHISPELEKSSLPEQRKLKLLMQYSVLPNMAKRRKLLIFPFTVKPKEEFTFDFSPVNKMLALSLPDKVAIWNIAETNEVTQNQQADFNLEHARPPLAFSPDQKFFVCNNYNQGFALYDAKSQKIIDRLPFFPEVDYWHEVCISNNNRWVATREKVRGPGSNNERVTLFDRKQSQHYHLSLGIRSTGKFLTCFSPDNKTVIGTKDGSVEAWETSTQKSKFFILNPGYTISAINYSPDGLTLIYGTKTGTIFLYDFRHKSKIALIGHRNRITSVLFHPQGRMFVTASEDGEVKLWDSVNKELLYNLDIKEEVNSLKFDPDGRFLHIITFHQKGASYYQWEIEPFLQKTLLLNPEGEKIFNILQKNFTDSYAYYPASIAISPLKRFIALPTGMLIFLWDQKLNKTYTLTPPISILPLKKSEIRECLLSRDERWIVSSHGGHHPQIFLRNTSTPKKIIPLGKKVSARMTFSPESKYLLIYSNDFLFYDIAKQKYLDKDNVSFPMSVTCMKFSPDGHWLAVGSEGSLVVISAKSLLKNRTTKDSFISTNEGKEESVTTLAWHQKKIATARLSGAIDLWENKSMTMNDWKKTKTLFFSEEAKQLQFSPNGRFLAIIFASQIIIYDIVYDNQARAVVGYFQAGVASFTSDWNYLVLPSSTGGAILFDTKSPQEILGLPSDKLKNHILNWNFAK